MDNMEKELWDAFYGKESKQERCSVLTEAELNKHNKGMLKESFMSDKDIHNQFSKFEVLDFSKEGEHSGYIELSFPNADEVDYDTSVITGYTIYEDGKVAFDNWFPDDVYNEVAEYVKQHHSEELDEGCGKKKKNKKKALKEDMEYKGHPYVGTNYIGKPLYDMGHGWEATTDEIDRIDLMYDYGYEDEYHRDYDSVRTIIIMKKDFDNGDLIINDENDKKILNNQYNKNYKYYDEEELDEGCGKKKKNKKKALKEATEPVYILVDVVPHSGIVILKSDEFGKVRYMPDDFEKQNDTIKRAIEDYVKENNIAEYEIIKLYESKKALKEDYEEDYEEDEELTPVDVDSLDVDEFYNDYVMDNAALWDEDIDYDAMEANKNQIFHYWKQLVKGGEDEWNAVEISVRRFASNEELDEGCGKKKKKSLKESDEDMSGYEDRLNKTIKSEMKKFPKYAADAKKALNDGDEIKKILNKYNQEYNFLYNNHDKVAGYEEAVRAWDEYINHPDFRELIGKVIKARHDMFTSDREIGALMFTLDALGYLDKFDGKESSLEPVVKEFKA